MFVFMFCYFLKNGNKAGTERKIDYAFFILQHCLRLERLWHIQIMYRGNVKLAVLLDGGLHEKEENTAGFTVLVE